MAKVSIEHHPEVLQTDLATIHARIARDDPAAADRVLDAVNSTFELIANEPGCGIIYRTRNPRLQSVRMFPVAGFPDYLLFYRVEGEILHHNSPMLPGLPTHRRYPHSPKIALLGPMKGKQASLK